MGPPARWAVAGPAAGPRALTPTMGESPIEMMGKEESACAALEALQERLRGILARVGSAGEAALEAQVREALTLVAACRSEAEGWRALLERFLDPAVLAHLLAADPPMVSGARREVTVLFADLQGYSDLCERVPLEELTSVLGRYLAVALEAIRGEGGVVDRWMGDAVLGWFNAPRDLPDHPYRALRAAWRMQQAVGALHPTLPPEGRRRFRIGLHTGEVWVGPLGTPDYWTYTVVGSVVNYARRLQEAAPPGQIMLSRAVFERLRDRIEARALPVFPVRRGDQVVPVYRFLGFREGGP